VTLNVNDDADDDDGKKNIGNTIPNDRQFIGWNMRISNYITSNCFTYACF